MKPEFINQLFNWTGNKHAILPLLLYRERYEKIHMCDALNTIPPEELGLHKFTKNYSIMVHLEEITNRAKNLFLIKIETPYGCMMTCSTLTTDVNLGRLIKRIKRFQTKCTI